MKKSLSLLIVAAVAFASLFAAPKKSQSKQPVELEYGTDYTIESTWYGEEYFLIDLTSIHFNKGAVNTNHAVILRIVPRELITKNSVIEVEYKMDKYDPSKSAQVCISPQLWKTPARRTTQSRVIPSYTTSSSRPRQAFSRFRQTHC